jgi:ELWxxDGT repeat protein
MRVLAIASLLSVFAVGCGDDSGNEAPNDGGPSDGASDGSTDGPTIETDPAPTGFEFVADLNTRRDSALTSSETKFVAAGSKVFFLADDGVHGVEPMVSDGTVAGTKLLKDLTPGVDGSSAGGFIAKGDKVYFFGRQGTTTSLYRSDGTPEGTTPIITAPGSASTISFAIGEKLCFLDSTLRCSDPAVTALTKIVDTSSSGPAISLGATALFTKDRALYMTDGVTATKLVDVAIRPGGVVIGSSAVFWAENSGQSRPYASDGTVAGSKPLATISASGEAPPMIAVAGNKALTVYGGEALILDPASGTSTKLTDLYATSAFGLSGGKALLSAERRSTTPAIGSELWITDGTDAGTRLLKELTPGSLGASIKWLGTIGTSAYFLASDSGMPTQRLYKSDGTDVGTVSLGEWKVDSGTDRTLWTSALGGLVFKCADSTSWRTLCTLDGSGKVTVIPINGATASSTPNSFVTVGDRMFFNANDGGDPISTLVGSMFVSNGTGAGTKRIGPRFGGKVATLGDKVYFLRATDGTDNKWELAALSGDVASTVVTFDNVGSLDAAKPYPIVPFNGKIYFAANATTGGVTIHSSDGTAVGTKSMLKAPSAAYAYLDGPTWPVLNGKLYVSTTEGIQVIDAAGTMTPLGAAPGRIGAMDAAESTIFFAIGGTLYFTDGTVPGTVMVKTITTTSSPIWKIIALRNDFAWVFTGSGSSPAVYSTDGTSAGTKLITTMPSWTRYREGLAFSASSGLSIVTPTLPPDVIGPPASNLLGAGDRIFFASSTATAGLELWISDGTRPGTKLAGDLRAGKESSTPLPQAVVGGYVYFAADDGAHGSELWRYKF